MHFSWLFFALLAPFLWSITNVLDGAVRRSHIQSDWVMTWLSTLLRFPIAMGFLLWTGIEFPGWSGFYIVLMGMIWTLMFVPYLKALEFEEPSRVALFLSSQSIFVFVLGYFALNENLVSNQIIAFVLIFLGGGLAGFRRLKGVWHLSSAFVLVVGASIFWALSDVVFKKMSVDFSGFMPAFSLFLFGSFLTAPMLFAFPFVRREISKFSFSNVSVKGWSMLIGSMALGVLGLLFFAYALIIGKVALTSVLTETQPLFVFLLTIIFSPLFKDIHPEDVTREALILKGTSLAVIVAGLIYLYL